MVRPTAAFMSVLALAAALRAQDAPRPRAPEPLVDLRVAGPALLRERFLATDLGSLLGSSETKATWSRLMLSVAGVWYRSEGANKEDSFGPFRDLLAGYRGEARLRAYAIPGRGPYGLAGWLRLAPDGKTDLAKVARGVRQLASNFVPAGVRPKTLPGRDVEYLAAGGLQVTLPRVVDEALEVVVAESVEAALPVVAAARAQPEVQAQPGTQRRAAEAPIRGRIDLAGLLEMTGRKGRPEWLSDFTSGMLGYDRMQTLAFEVAPAGPHVRFDVELTSEKLGTVYDVLLSETKEPPPIHRVPDVPFFTYLPVSYTKLLDSVAVFIADEDDFLVLLQNLRPGLLVLGKSIEAPCLVLTVKPGEDVDAAIDGVSAKLGEAEKRANYRGVTVTEFRAGREDAGYRARHGQRLYLGIGRKGHDALKAALDVELAGQDAGDSAAATGLPRATLRRYERFRLPHCNGTGVLALDALGETLVPFLIGDWYSWLRKRLAGVIDLPNGGPAAWKDGRAKLLPLLKMHRLDDVMWFSARKGERLTLRFLW